MTRRAWIASGVVVLLVAGGWLAWSARQGKDAGEVRIGAILPLSGRFAFMGEPIRAAMDAAVADVNASPGRKLEILYYDSQGDPKAGVTAAQRLIDLDGVRIITTFLTGVSEAVKTTTEERGALLIAQTVSPTITEGTKNTVRMHYSFVAEGEALARHIIATTAGPVGFIRSRDPSTSYEVEKVILPRLEAAGMTGTVDETFDVGAKDFKPQVLKLQGAKVKLVCILGYGSDFSNLLKDLKSLGLKDSSGLCGNLGFVELAPGTPPELYEGAVFTAPPFLLPNGRTPAIEALEGKVRGAAGPLKSYSGYYAFDTVELIRKAIDAAGSDEPVALRKALIGGTFEVATGRYHFSGSGDFAPPVTLGTFRNGKMEDFAGAAPAAPASPEIR